MVWDDERVWAVVTVIAGTPLAIWVKGRWDTRRGTTERISDAGAAAIEREAARGDRASEQVVDWMARALQAEAREVVLRGKLSLVCMQRDEALRALNARAPDVAEVLLADADEASSLPQGVPDDWEPRSLAEVTGEVSDAEESEA